jgi:hypothetical protein
VQQASNCPRHTQQLLWFCRATAVMWFVDMDVGIDLQITECIDHNIPQQAGLFESTMYGLRATRKNEKINNCSHTGTRIANACSQEKRAQGCKASLGEGRFSVGNRVALL